MPLHGFDVVGVLDAGLQALDIEEQTTPRTRRLVHAASHGIWTRDATRGRRVRETDRANEGRQRRRGLAPGGAPLLQGTSANSAMYHAETSGPITGKAVPPLEA